MRIEPPLSRLSHQPLKHCAICGHGIDENGTQPGRKLTEDEKQLAWVHWLARNGLTPEIIHSHYRLSQQDFFANQTLPVNCGELITTKIQP